MHAVEPASQLLTTPYLSHVSAKMGSLPFLHEPPLLRSALCDFDVRAVVAGQEPKRQWQYATFKQSAGVKARGPFADQFVAVKLVEFK